jgi:hypothetical protein
MAAGQRLQPAMPRIALREPARGICAETCSLSLTAIRRASSPVKQLRRRAGVRVIMMVVTDGRCQVGQGDVRLGDTLMKKIDGVQSADLSLNVALTNSAIASPDIIGKWQWQNQQNQPSSRFWY